MGDDRGVGRVGRGADGGVAAGDPLVLAQVLVPGRDDELPTIRGDRPFLSRRTVGSHLYHLFPKLEVTARGQLAGALSR